MTNQMQSSNRADWLGEILAILDESQGIRERVQDMGARLRRVLPLPIGVDEAVKNLLVLEGLLDTIVENDLAVTYRKISTEKKCKST